MSMAPKQAQTAIEKQIEILDSLHNATTRAHEFREWRQVTLTLIERVWPDQPARAQRFRRVPFSPAAMRADDKVTREAFERGCAEARRLLQLWSTEIAAHGLDHEAEAPRLSEAARMVGDAPDQSLEFAPVGDFMPTHEDAGDDEEATQEAEDADSLEIDHEAPVPAPPPARTPPPAPHRPAPPQARAQAPAARPAPQQPQRQAQPPARPAPQQPQRQAQPPARPAPPPAPARQAEPPRPKQEKRRGLREMLGLVRHTPPPPEPEVQEEPAPIAEEPAPPGDDNALRRMLELELESLNEQGIEEHADDGAGEEPRLEIENNTFLGGSSSGAPPMTPAGEHYLTLDGDTEEESAPPPARPAVPLPRPAAQQRGPASQRPAPPAQRPASQQPQRPVQQPQRPVPQPQQQRPAAPPQRPVQATPQQQRPAPMQGQRPQAPAPPPRPVRSPPPPPPAQPARPQQPLRPVQGGAQRPQAPPPGRPQQQQPARGPMPQRPAAPPPAHHQQQQHPQQRPAAGSRPGVPAASGQRPGARPPERPAHLEVERFERPEPMPRRGSNKKRRRDEDEYDDQNALAEALGALEQVRHDDGDDDYDDGPHDGVEHDDDDDTSPGLGDVHMVSYVARTFIGLAADVDELGIPQGHQERVRLALLDLAHYLDTGNVTWAILRDAITLVMHYPALGRQALPLLMPYIETAA